ncbi:pilus assembly PilX N-terminal domain-containing protein [Zhongshania borealis]|uniref:Type 4 fimbrial biogenesis protein PilX N-terminal domain-containing protein n=1 Tax=Zhongshania borealis TaxID=889488 RepID=A0ABP7X3A6_9GAMM
MKASGQFVGRQQRGVVLIVVLIMLGVFSVIVVSMIGGSNINFKIAGNQQYRMEAKMAARNGVESYISNPANFALPLPTSDAFVNSDFNGDGVADMIAVVAPPDCLRAVPILQSALDVADPHDAQCLGSAQQNNSGLFHASGASSAGNSWCSKMTWDVGARVSDAKTGVDVAMHQGVYLRAIIGTTCL